MKNTLVALAAASALAIGIASSTPAEARCGTGCAWGIGVGSFVGGAIVGSTVARPGWAYYGYEPAPGYVAYTGYVAGPPVGCPGGYWARRPLYDQWGNQVGWTRPKFFCPY